MPAQTEVTNEIDTVRQRPSQSAHVVAFVSAKGGSGKTLLTATAAYLLEKAGKHVLLIDTDFSTRGLTLYLMGPASRERHLVVRPTNCLSGSLFDGLSVESIEPRKIPRKELSFNLILSSFQAWTSNKPDDRIVGDFADQDSGSKYFTCLADLLKHFRSDYDYILVDTRGGYDFTSAAPALLCDEYVVVLEADQISVAQVYGLKEGIESWGRRYEVRPALSGFVINKATFTLETRSFPDTLFNLYGGVHFGTIPLDYEAVRAYQIRDIPTDSRPDSDFAFHSYSALERVFSPSLNWEKDECAKFERIGSQIRTLWRARRSWEFAERVLPAAVLVLALITAASYFYVRNSKVSVSLTPFYLSASVFVLTSTLISAFILLKNIQKWRIPSTVRIVLGVYGLCAALGLSYLTLIDVRRTFAKDALLSRIESQNQLIAQQTDRIASLSLTVSDSEQKRQFALADRDRAEQQLKTVEDQLAYLNKSEGPVVESQLTAGGIPLPDLGPQTPGCDCGPSTIAIKLMDVSLKSDEWARLTWDAHWICQGQGVKNNDGKISWDAQSVDKLPDSNGTARFRFHKPGAYSINLDYSAFCLDKNNGGSRCWPNGNFCKAYGTARVNVK